MRLNNFSIATLSFVVFLTRATTAAQAAPTLEVFPAEVHLRSKVDHQSFVVRVIREDGIHVDVTSDAKVVVENPALASIDKDVVRPKAEGATKLNVQWQNLSAAVPLTVEKIEHVPAVSFRLDVMPVLMKAECNRCHGAARGQDGFRLSLWGFDPEGDHFRITREIPGRRINLAVPEDSLLLTKSDGEAAHTGGKKFEKGSPLYNTMLAWLKAGAPNDPPETPTLTGVELSPRSLVLEGPGQKFRMNVIAKYSDGTTRDVTTTALFLSNNEGTAKLDAEGNILAGQRGEAFVMARYGAYTVGSQVVVLPKNLKFEWPKIEEPTEIDRLVNSKLRDLREIPSEGCDDLTFLRRIYIDLTGSLPPLERVQSFPADQNPAKREALIDELLKRPEFVDLWTLKWADLLQIRTILNTTYNKNVQMYHDWLRDQILAGVPLNQLAAQLITASGSNFDNPAANFYSMQNDPIRVTEDAVQAFFGIRIQCAQCHNHPFDRWTMADYRGFMAFFMQVGRKRGEDPREKIIYNQGSGEALHPVGGKAVPPRFLGGIEPDVKGRDRREVLAEWLADPKNPWFSQNISNLVWAHLIGVGVINPVDDIRISNPPSNLPLLEYLSKRLVEYNFDIRKLAKEICMSATYQRSTHANETNQQDERNFAKATIRRMRAEVLLDAIADATGTAGKQQGLPQGMRSVEVADAKRTNYFLTTFGRATRENVCARDECGPTLSQALHLLTGDSVDGNIKAGAVVTKLLAAGKKPNEIMIELYLRCLGRPPTPEESASLEALFSDPEQTKATLEDVQWALLNSKEFIFNH